MSAPPVPLTPAVRRRPQAPAALSASVVIPVHGREALTKRCLDAVLADLPRGCEVIVVDDASPDSTPALLDAYGEAIRVRRLTENVGYGGACNAGAAIARRDALVFLNNDTEPRRGWLRALTEYACAHPPAAVVGAKLLYPTGTVQHAGVVIGQDGYPHNLYAGLPAEHPAVERSRRLQAVTGAAMLVRRVAFERAGGFDPAYLNSLEDVDLCLRIGMGGGEVHYCHRAVVTHLESASRGREGHFERSVARYRRRWRDRARRDDLAVYAEDGLLEVEYRDSYPQRLSVSPLLAVVDAGREREIETLLERYAAQVSDLLAEVMRLTALVGSPAGSGGANAVPSAAHVESPAGALAHHSFLAEAGRMEEQARRLQQRVQEGLRTAGADGRAGFGVNRRLGYRRLADRVCAAVCEAVPAGSEVLVISRGDRDLTRVSERRATHFPQAPGGRYLGHHPRDSEQAIAHLEELRGDGAEYLVIPSVYRWWLDHYRAFAEHLASHYTLTELPECSIYELRPRPHPTSQRTQLEVQT